MLKVAQLSANKYKYALRSSTKINVVFPIHDYNLTNIKSGTKTKTETEIETNKEVDYSEDERKQQDVKLFAKCFTEMYNICKRNDWGDPFSYARSREIHMANTLNHTVAPTLSGADAFDSDGACEYKSTVSKVINATYNGISVQDTWEHQWEYMVTKKIGCYKNHYYARYDGPDIVELYKMPGELVLSYMKDRLKTKFEKENKGKDPRLGITIPKSYIITNASRVI